MKLRILLTAAALALSSAAWANRCPLEMKAIDEALSKQPQLSAEQLAQVKQYRAEGEALHKAGRHKESVDALEKAKKILNLQ